MSAQLLNPPRVPLMRRPEEPKEFCQDCLNLWGRQTVLNPLGDCPVCDAPEPEDFSSDAQTTREMLGIGGK